MATAIVLRRYGGPEVLTSEPVEVGRPGPGELRVRQTAIGVNFHDCYVRSGLYRTLAVPGIPGIEAAGVIEEIGPGVSGFAVGDPHCLCHRAVWSLCVGAPDAGGDGRCACRPASARPRRRRCCSRG